MWARTGFGTVELLSIILVGVSVGYCTRIERTDQFKSAVTAFLKNTRAYLGSPTSQYTCFLLHQPLDNLSGLSGLFDIVPLVRPHCSSLSHPNI